MGKTCDMHIHTNNSDGNLGGVELLDYAKERDLRKLAITDHDCVDFYFDKNAMAAIRDFDWVTGCEFACAYEDVPIEIVGLGIDVTKAKQYLDKHGVTENRIERYRSDMTPKVFAKHGIKLAYDPDEIDFTKKCPMVLEKLHEVILQDPVATSFLFKENPNLLKSVSAFLREGLNNPKSKIFISPNSIYPDYTKIVKLIKDIGGLAFLAHPYQYGENMNRVLEGVKGDVDGIECYHYSTQEKGRTEYLQNFCKQNAIMVSGGSDFHIKGGAGDKDLLNKLGIPEQYFDIIKAKLLEKQM